MVICKKNSLVFLSQKHLCMNIHTVYAYIGVNLYRLGCFLVTSQELVRN